MDIIPRRSLLIAIFVGGLDQTVIAAALPAIVAEFFVPFNHLDQAAWVITVYLVGYVIAIPLAGRFIDLRRALTVFLPGIATFGLGSTICALASGLPWLVGGRLVQALGAGSLLPVAFSLGGTFYSARRLRWLAMVAAVAEGGAVLGPLYGGLILQILDWHWIFWLNLPVVAALLTGGVPRRIGSKSAVAASDFISPLLLGLALGWLIAAISRQALQLAPSVPAILLALALLCLGLLLWRERTASNPAFGTTLVRRYRFWGIVLLHLLLGLTLMTPLVLVPVWASTLLDQAPSRAALILFRLTVMIPAGAGLSAIISTWVARSAVAALGFALSAVGLALMAHWGVDTNELTMTPALLIAGAGFGLLLPPMTETALLAAESGLEGTSLGLATGARVVGMAIGLTVMTTWGLDHLDSLLATVPVPMPLAAESADAFQVRMAAYRIAATELGVSVFSVLFSAGAVAAAMGALGCFATIPHTPLSGVATFVSDRDEARA